MRPVVLAVAPWLVWGFIFGITTTAHADGVFYELNVEKPPPIPSQRALISYRDGMETLLVESTTVTEPGELAWIIPVPARPVRYAAAEPGLLETLHTYTASRVQMKWHWRFYLLYAALLGLLALVSLCAIPRPYLRHYRPWPWLPLYVLVAPPLVYFVAVTSTRSTRQEGATPPPGIVAVETHRVGNYEVQLIEATQSTGLQTWLDQAGFGALPDHARTVVDAYIADGWLFVASRLEATEEGPLRPHPLALTFPADDPVYPMRLTALAGTDTYVELYVVASQQAQPWRDVLELWYSTGVTKSQNEARNPCDSGGVPVFNLYHGQLEHPDAGNYFWDRAVLTRLTGTFSPEKMADDVELHFGPYSHYRRKVIAANAAREQIVAMALLALATLWLMADTWYWRPGRTTRPRYALAVGLPAVTAAALIALAAYVALPPIIDATSDHDAKSRYADAPDFWRLAREIDREHPDIWSDAARLRQLLAERLESTGAVNPFTGGPVHEEASPGNYAVYETECGVFFDAYDSFGAERYPSSTTLTYHREDELGYINRGQLFDRYLRTAAWVYNNRHIEEDAITRYHFAVFHIEDRWDAYCRFEIDPHVWSETGGRRGGTRDALPLFDSELEARLFDETPYATEGGHPRTWWQPGDYQPLALRAWDSIYGRAEAKVCHGEDDRLLIFLRLRQYHH